MPLPLRYSVGSLAVRRTRTLLTVGVIALVVIATTLFAALVSSLKRSTATAGSERNLIVMRKGSTNDGSSYLTREAFQAIQFFDGIGQDAGGEPLISPELVVQPFFYTADGGRENVLVRGVEEVALAVHDQVEIVEGRMFERSSNEVIVGRGVAGRYLGAALGEGLSFGRGTWKVVGVFEADGTSMESEVWMDANELARDTRREGSYSGFRIRVAPGADMDALARRIDDDPRYALEAGPEVAYYAKQAESADPFYVLVIGLALLAGVGATFGATNTLYASVQARTAEIGTLRALGFSRAAILGSFLVESLAIALMGLLVGGLLAVALAAAISGALGGIAFGAQTFSTNVVELRVGAFDLVLAAILSLTIGLVGGFFPAMRAARLRPVEALRKA
jgi:ABC-type lipoprotein release transport system permease subunit